jgi:hypothetical protein
MKMQMPGNQSDDRDEALEAPARLIAALRQLPSEKIFVPRTTDEAILRAARAHLSPARKSYVVWLRFAPWATAAAVGIFLLFLTINSPQPSPGFVREDINHDRTVDILDAFALAKSLEAGASSGTGIDLNGDGKVDQQDVEALAAQAVSLEKGGHS